MRRYRLLCGCLGAGLALALATAAFADPAKSPAPQNDSSDPPGTTLSMDRFRALFAAWDLNGDGALDKDELARAFRGSDAKAYDYKKDSDKEATNDPVKDVKPAKTPDYSEYPDYQFLVQLDQDGDHQISRAEFMSWARDYAVQLKQQTDQEAKVLAIQAKMQAATTAKEIKTLQKELTKEQAAFSKLNSQTTKEMKAIEKVMQHVKK